MKVSIAPPEFIPFHKLTQQTSEIVKYWVDTGKATNAIEWDELMLDSAYTDNESWRAFLELRGAEAAFIFP